MAQQPRQESLRAVLPDVPDAALGFRVKCVGGIILELSGWALEPDLRGTTPEQVEDLLVPTIAGALAGEQPPWPASCRSPRAREFPGGRPDPLTTSWRPRPVRPPRRTAG
jgi:hypothetical protein